MYRHPITSTNTQKLNLVNSVCIRKNVLLSKYIICNFQRKRLKFFKESEKKRCFVSVDLSDDVFGNRKTLLSGPT